MQCPRFRGPSGDGLKDTYINVVPLGSNHFLNLGDTGNQWLNIATY